LTVTPATREVPAEVDDLPQKSIIVKPPKKTQRQKASEILTRLLPSVGSRCSRNAALAETAKAGVSWRSFQREYGIHGVVAFSNWEGAWLERRELSAAVLERLAGGDL
jgi:hypothetical protein